MQLQHQSSQDQVKAVRGLSKICMENTCQKSFDLFRKEHVCKRCMKSVCSQCSIDKTLIAYYDYQPKIKHRTCKTCMVEKKFQKTIIDHNKLAFGRTSPLALQYLLQLKLITNIDNESELLKLEQSYEKTPSSNQAQKIDFKSLQRTLSFSFKDYVFTIQSHEETDESLSMKLNRLLSKLMASFGWEKIPSKFPSIALFFLSIASEAVAFYILSEIYNKLLPKYIIDYLKTDYLNEEKLQQLVKQLLITYDYPEPEEKKVQSFIQTFGFSFLGSFFVDMISVECTFFVVDELIANQDFEEVENFFLKLIRQHRQFILKASFNTEELKYQVIQYIIRNSTPVEIRENARVMTIRTQKTQEEPEEKQDPAVEEEKRRQREAEEQEKAELEKTLKNEMRQSKLMLSEKDQELNKINSELKSLRNALAKSKEVQTQRDLLLIENTNKDQLINNLKEQIEEQQKKQALAQHPHNNEALDKLWNQLQELQLKQTVILDEKRVDQSNFQNEKEALVQKYTVQLAEQNAQMEELQEKVKNYEEQLTQSDDSKRLLNSEKQMKSRFDEIEELRRLLDEQTKTEEQRETERKNQKESEENRLKAQEQAMIEFSNQVEELKKNLEQMSQAKELMIADHKATMELAVKNYELSVEDLKLQIEEHESTIEQLKQQLDQSNGREKKQKIEIDSLNQHIVLLQNELEKAKETSIQLNEATGKILELSTNVRERDNVIEKLRTELNLLQTQYTTDTQVLQGKIQQEIQEKQAKEKANQDLIAALEKMKAEKASSEEAWAQERQAASMSEQSLKNEIAGLQNKLKEAIEKAAALEQSVSGIKKESEARRMRINDLDLEIIVLKQKLEHVEEEAKEIEEFRSTFDARLSEKDSVLSKKDQTIEEMQEIIRKLKEELEKTSKKLMEVLPELNKFKSIFTSVKQNIDDI